MKEEIILQNVSKILDGDCVLFTGAGFSMSATNMIDEKLKNSEKLKEKLFDLSGLDNSGTLDWAVESYIKAFSEGELIRLLRNLFLVRSVSEEQRVVISQNWKGIYTTNYDNVIETIFSDAKRLVHSTTSLSRPSQFTKKRELVVHINGFIENLNEDEGLPKGFLLNELSYITSHFVNSDWYNHLQSDLITSDAVFFVGFSMRSDLDLERIIYTASSESKKEKIFFIVKEDEPESSVRFLSKFGTVLPIGVDGFSKLIEERKRFYVPRQSGSLKLFSFKEISLVSKAERINTNEVFDLFFYGKCSQAHIESSISNPSAFRYYFPRLAQTEIIKSIENNAKNILISSDLGNGKSMLIEGLKVLLASQGRKVFHFFSWYDTAEVELQQICELYPSSVIIIENYNQALKLFEILSTRRGGDMVVITSERSAVHETTSHKLEKYFGSEYLTFYLDRLEDSEIDVLVTILEQYGLWGDYSNLLPAQKKEFIKVNCSCSLRVLLLRIIESKSILDKFKQVLGSLSERKDYYEAIVLILSSNLFNVTIGLDQLISILNDDKFRKPRFLQDSAIREIVDISSNQIKVKSSVLSETLLSKASNAFSIVRSLIKISKQLDLWADDQVCKSLLREYVSYSNIYLLIKSDNDSWQQAIDYYFDELRNLNFCRENPHYWLQYAILNLEKGQLELAKTQFDTAYSFAKKRSRFDTYQLDNQYARYLLLSQLASEDVKSCMPTFREVHRILTNNLSPNKLKYYPYRVANLYVDIYNKFFKSLTDNERDEFLRYLKEMNLSIEAYLKIVEDYRTKRFVLKTQEKILHIINISH